MSSDLIEQLTKNAKKKHIIELKLQEQELEEALRVISTEIPSKKRKPNKSEGKEIIKTSATDTTKIKELRGTLSDNLIRLTPEIADDNIKNRYFLNLSENCIIDISNDEHRSQIALLGGSNVKQFLERFKHDVPETYNLKRPFIFDKVDGIKSLKAKLRQLDMYHPKNKKERVSKKICNHILYQCAYSPHSDKYFTKCSNQSLLIHYWVNMFEYYFAQKNTIFIQSENAVSLNCIKSKLTFNLTAEKDNNQIDMVNGEIASTSGSTRGKYYKDGLKLALSAKQHLNHIVSSLSNITVEDLVNIKLPIIQIMGLNAHISCLSIADKNLYVLQDIYSFNYPTSIKEIREGAIGRMMTGLSLIDDMLSSIDSIYENFSCNTGDKIDNIKSGKNQKKNTGKCDEYISSVIWNSSDDDDNNSADSKDEIDNKSL